jgi:hypothetical protein
MIISSLNDTRVILEKVFSPDFSHQLNGVEYQVVTYKTFIDVNSVS